MWLGWAYYVLGLIYVLSGDFELAVEAAARVDAIAEAIGDHRLQTNAATTIGWSLVTRGDWEAGIEAYQRALERSPDPFEAALVLGFLGYAYVEKGDVAKAIPMLEQAVQQANQYRSLQVQGWFKTFLGEAYLLNGQIEKAHDLALQGLALTRDIKNWWGVGVAQCALGRIARASGTLSEAKTYFHEALDTFTSIQARFEVGRTHLDLAVLAHAAGDREAATTHLTEAHGLFMALQVPKYVARAEQCAQEFGVERFTP